MERTPVPPPQSSRWGLHARSVFNLVAGVADSTTSLPTSRGKNKELKNDAKSPIGQQERSHGLAVALRRRGIFRAWKILRSRTPALAISRTSIQGGLGVYYTIPRGG
ncbi:hypothetical protein VTO42DRAFT_2486 [Malbranchea cinnamomea]